MKTIKTHTIILFLIVLATGLAASCDQPIVDQTQVQEDEPAAEVATSFDAMAQIPMFDTTARECTNFVALVFAKVNIGIASSAAADLGDQIEIESWSWGASTSGVSSHSGRGIGRAKVRVRPFVITKPVDRTSPALRQLATTGEPIPVVVFELRMTCGKEEVETETITIVLEEVTIAQISTRGSSRQIPTEFVSFNYSKISLLLPAIQQAREVE